MIADFHFVRPLWFVALLPMIWLIWQITRYKANAGGWQRIIPPHLVNHLIQGKNAKQHQPYWLLALAWLLVVVALAGPSWEKLPQPVYQTNTGKVIVMDMSVSMHSTDLTPDRLTKARFKAIDLIERIDDADMGLVAYSGDAFVISPLTADSKNLTALVPSLSPGIMPVSGSNPITGIMLADELLKNAGYARGEIFLLTDGIEMADVPVIDEFLRTVSHRVSVLGIGTAEGAPIKLPSGELLKDRRGSITIPKLNDGPLRKIAQSTGGVYSRITSTDIDIQTLAKQQAISHEAKKDQEQLHQGDQYKEFGPVLVLILLPFAAYAFRRGLVVCIALSFALLNPKPAHAGWWQDLWQTKDQQAYELFHQDKYPDAAANFEDPNWKGASLYRSGDYEGALSEFQKSDTASSLYNQGNALAQLKRFDEAIDAYKQALQKAPEMQDAKNNIELLEQLKKQQEQQQQQQGGQDQQQQNQQDQQNQQQGQDGQEGQDQQQSQDGEQSDEQQSADEQQQEKDKQDPQSRANNQQSDEENDPQNRQAKGDDAEKDLDGMQQQKKPGEQRDEEQPPEGEEAQQLKPEESQLSREEKEQMQEIQQLLRKIPDDPSILLRNKMRLEYQKRKYQQQQNTPPGE